MLKKRNNKIKKHLEINNLVEMKKLIKELEDEEDTQKTEQKEER